MTAPPAQAPSLWAPLEQARPSGPLLRVLDGTTWVDWSWDEWRRQASEFAGGLRTKGVRPGDRVACLLTNSPSSCAALLGAWMAGACVVSLPGMARGMAPERYQAQLRAILDQAQAVVLLVASEYFPLIAMGCPAARVIASEELKGSPLSEPCLQAEDDAVFVQYSSGSVSDPKGCLLSARSIACQLALLATVLEIDPERDVSVDWVPLSHDMGIFGCLLLTAYWTGTRQVLSTPGRFVTRPQSWFGDCADNAATISCGPNFALELAARAAPLLPPNPIPMRRLVLGGERIDPRTLERACAALGPSRLPWEALLPAYGLAEAVLAVTATPVGAGAKIASLDRASLRNGRVEPSEPNGAATDSTRIASVGLPLPGTEIDLAGDGAVGEIRLRSPSLATGYLGLPTVTEQRFTASGLVTGDTGFLRDGSLYIVGRTDDLLTIAGRNVYARDIEAAIIATGGVRLGSCAVVRLDDGVEPRLVAVIEAADHHPDFGLMAKRMSLAALSVAGVRLSECLFLPRGLFPKTPSGKTQRFRCRELAADRGLKAAKRISLAESAEGAGRLARRFGRISADSGTRA